MLKENIYQMKAVTDRLPEGAAIRFHMCGTTYPNRNYFISRPHSSVCCIEYIVRGSGQVNVNGHLFTAKAGDTYYLPVGASHYYESDRKEPWEKIWINLSGEMPNQLAKLYGMTDVYHFPMLDTSDLLQKFQYYAERPSAEQTAEKCCALVSQLFFRMSRSLCKIEQTGRTPVQIMLAYIEQHETDAIRLEQLAAACRKSPSQAERLFRKEVGQPPYRYVLNRKIDLACQLLRETGMPIRDIAAYLSFDDEFYFSGLFRRKIGLSPTQYRKNESSNEPS